MAKQFSREEILKNMREKIARKEALLVCGCGTGLIARLCDQAGVDLIGCYNTGRYRMNGIASIAGNLPIGNANEVMFDMAVKDILPVVKNTPVIGGIFGLDPTRDMQRFLKSCYDIGLFRASRQSVRLAARSERNMSRSALPSRKKSAFWHMPANLICLRCRTATVSMKQR